MSRVALQGGVDRPLELDPPFRPVAVRSLIAQALLLAVKADERKDAGNRASEQGNCSRDGGCNDRARSLNAPFPTRNDGHRLHTRTLRRGRAGNATAKRCRRPVSMESGRRTGGDGACIDRATCRCRSGSYTDATRHAASMRARSLVASVVPTATHGGVVICRWPSMRSMAGSRRGCPADRAPAPWPEVPSEDPLAEVAREFAVRLRQAMGAQSIRAVATEAGVAHVTLLRVLNGLVWPDLATVTRLEIALDADLHSSRAVREAHRRLPGSD